MATTHRLHIENLPANLTPDEIKQRFSSFGTVERVDGFNQLNAVGLPNTFCFIELAATEAGLKKCEHCP